MLELPRGRSASDATQDWVDSTVSTWMAGEIGRVGVFIEESLQLAREVADQVIKAVSGVPTKPRGADSARAVLIHWVAKRLSSAYDRLMNGYLSDAIILCRAAYEGLVLLVLFNSDPDIAVSWMNGKYISQKEAREAIDKSASLKSAYALLSSVAHPNDVGAICWEVERAPEWPNGMGGFTLGGVKNRANARATASSLAELCGGLLNQVVRHDPKVFRRDQGERLANLLIRFGAEVSPEVQSWRAELNMRSRSEC